MVKFPVGFERQVEQHSAERYHRIDDWQTNNDSTTGEDTMKGLRFSLIIVLAAGVWALAAKTPPSSQLSQARVSPHDAINRNIDRINRVTIYYGRPFSKDPKTGELRKIWGGLVPYGRVWRLGADEATLLVTQQPIMIGSTEIPSGAHSLFMLPDETGTSKLIINNQIGQWGLQYDEKQDFVRVDLVKTSVDPQVDQLTMAIDSNPSGGGVIKITWEKTQFSVAFTNAAKK